ncbi:hypothetical protein [Hymenobacter edaphi]|uniref:AraC family transcriptional regulator n=1 Tax=Hymenobacter edaphi TaxID=2211146 RepID=A0A328BFC9_9BACT|nr:hypothetical protein [Hymenobacter edaphi]RAK64564.1 hypothetical protein DLM85_17885 [Hymenobacter edaphi]
MARWFFIIGGVLLLGFAGVYTWLGGFSTPQIDLITTGQPVFLAGKAYKGLPDKQFGKLYAEANELYRKGTLKGTLGNIYYNDAVAEGEEIDAFVGLVVADTVSQALPVGYRYRSFAAGQRVLRARVKANFMLAPGRLYPALQEAVKARKLTSRNVFLEQFPEDAPAEMLLVVAAPK